MDHLSDIRRIAAGDSAAFGRLVAAHQGMIFGYLGRMGLDAGSAEDIAQETFLRLWRHAAGYAAERAGVTTWLLTIARNLALNHLARPSRRAEAGSADDLPEIADAGPGPDEVLVRKERQARLRTALAQLSHADRSLIAAAYVEDVDIAGLARLEGCSAGAAKTRLHRARARLRLLLEDGDEG